MPRHLLEGAEAAPKKQNQNYLDKIQNMSQKYNILFTFIFFQKECFKMGHFQSTKPILFVFKAIW